MTWLRDVDRWFIGNVLWAAADYRALAARIVGTDEADDIVQEAYARLIDYEKWRQVEDARALCLRIIRNLAIDRLRSADVLCIDRFADLNDLDHAADSPDAFRVVAAKMDKERVFALIARLPPQCSRVVRLRKIEGRSPREIADLLGISVSTVETHLAKGVRAVVKAMREEEPRDVGASAGHPWIRRRRRP